LGHLSALLCELVGLDLGARLLHDDDHRGRVALARPSLPDLLELSLTQPRRYGRTDPFVLGRLLMLLRELGWVVQDPIQRRAVVQQLERLRATVHGQDFDPTETERLDALAELVEQALEGRWPVGDLS